MKRTRVNPNLSNFPEVFLPLLQNTQFTISLKISSSQKWIHHCRGQVSRPLRSTYYDKNRLLSQAVSSFILSPEGTRCPIPYAGNP